MRLPALLLLLHGRALGVLTGLSQYQSRWMGGQMDGWVCGKDAMEWDAMGWVAEAGLVDAFRPEVCIISLARMIPVPFRDKWLSVCVLMEG